MVPVWEEMARSLPARLTIDWSVASWMKCHAGRVQTRIGVIPPRTASPAPLNLVVRCHVTISRTFRTSPGSYGLAGICSLPLLIGIFRGFNGDMNLLLVSAIMPAVVALWLAWFRLRLDDSGIEYRDLLGKNFRVAYSEIASLKSRTVSYGRGFGYEWILHLRDGRKLRLNLKPFPRETYRVLCQRISCDP